MLVGVIGLTKRLLSGYVILTTGEHALGSWCSIRSWELSVGEHAATVVEPLLLLLGTLLEEYFPEHILFFLVGVVIFDVIIMRLIKNTI